MSPSVQVLTVNGVGCSPEKWPERSKGLKMPVFIGVFREDERGGWVLQHREECYTLQIAVYHVSNLLRSPRTRVEVVSISAKDFEQMIHEGSEEVRRRLR